MNIRQMALAVSGEPFMHDGLAEMVSYAKQLNIPYVFITTNGTVCNEESLKSVFDAGLDSIKFSINAGSPETYTLSHGADGYEKAVKNLIFAHRYRKENGLSFRILTGFVVTKLTKDEISAHYEKLKRYVDDILFVTPVNRGGNIVAEVENFRAELNSEEIAIDKKHLFDLGDAIKIPCPWPFNTMTVTSEGYLIACCSDNEGFTIAEDLNVMSLKDAWFSPRMVALRQRHIDNNLGKTACFNCVNKITGDIEPLNEMLFKACH